MVWLNQQVGRCKYDHMATLITWEGAVLITWYFILKLELCVILVRRTPPPAGFPRCPLPSTRRFFFLGSWPLCTRHVVLVVLVVVLVVLVVVVVVVTLVV